MDLDLGHNPQRQTSLLESASPLQKRERHFCDKNKRVKLF